MEKVKFLIRDEVYPFYDCKGNDIKGYTIKLKKGIKSVNIQHTYPVILVEDKEELIEILNKKYKLDIAELLGIYRVENTYGSFYIYYKSI